MFVALLWILTSLRDPSCSVAFTTLDQHPERSWTVHQQVPSRKNWSPWLERSPPSWISNSRWDVWAKHLGEKNIYNHWKLNKIGMIILWCGWGFQSLLESMMDTAESLCPHVMKRGNLRPELMKASSTKMVVPKCFVTQTLLEQSGVDIINKIRSVSPLHWLWMLFFYPYIDFLPSLIFWNYSVKWNWVWPPFCRIASLMRS